MGEKNIPLMITHGVIDEIIPVRHGKSLFDSYKSPHKVRNDICYCLHQTSPQPNLIAYLSLSFQLGIFSVDSDHNTYNVMEDVVEPLLLFLERHCDSS